MNSVAVDALPSPVPEKRFVSSILLAMLFVVIGLTFVTVAVGEEDSMLNTSAMLALLGPIAMFLLAWMGANQYANRTDNVVDDSQSPAIGGSDDSQYFPVWLGQSLSKPDRQV